MSLDHARQTIANGLRELMDTALESDDPSLVAHCFASLRDFRQDAATIADDVEQHLMSCMGESSLEVKGLGVVESHPKVKRSGWQWDDLLESVMATLDLETPDQHDGALAAAQIIQKTIGFRAGKVTGLGAIGLQPDEFCKEEFDGWAIQLPPRSHENDLL